MAHGDVGVLAPVSIAQVDGAMAIDVQVVLTYENDGERVEDGAAVVARAMAADGATAGPVTLTAASAPGAFVGELPVPAAGEWTVHLEATDPAATLEVPVTVEVAAATTASTVEATTTATGELRAAGDDDGGSALPVVGLGLLVAIGAAIGYRLTRHRR
ncbi:MAG TPA: hypothetical protein VEA78_01965 [Acidimicrobiales bacterium]|nr:hypothetical protein [Acidimicrobiales bacterium]